MRTTVKRRESGFTVVELLAVVGIIALLIGLLIPALATVRRVAKETKQKAQLTTIELALVAFKNDYGDYPPSDWMPGVPGPSQDYCGAQKLSEALLGWDLLGFHPRSAWRADGLDENGAEFTYDPAKLRADASLYERKGPYLELGTASAYRLGDVSAVEPGLFPLPLFGTVPLAPNTFVLCDVFGWRKIVQLDGKIVKAGAPILYYRANTAAKNINSIYDIRDNDGIVELKYQVDGRGQPLGGGPYPPPFSNQIEYFYGTADPFDGITGYIQDPKVTTRPWPYKPDSYILISAGMDGIYGTGDDITNFGN
ncbi:MAG: hypothetical protein JSU70_23705 [Phycisphaerales bacterium]|nr:MAG: hypothetical protein JSU70_23705 [Phycisphaerales bacterium]